MCIGRLGTSPLLPGTLGLQNEAFLCEAHGHEGAASASVEGTCWVFTVAIGKQDTGRRPLAEERMGSEPQATLQIPVCDMDGAVPTLWLNHTFLWKG